MQNRTPILLATVVALGAPLLGACEIDDDNGLFTDTTSDVTNDVNGTPDATTDGATDDVVEGPTYTGVLVVDLWDEINCGSTNENRMAPGADIDAVELLDGDGETLAYLDVVDGVANPTDATICAGNAYDDPAAALGAPDVETLFPELDNGDYGGGHFALEGGWLVGEFENAIAIQPGDSIKVWESGTKHDLVAEGKDEPYELYLVTNATCNPRDGMDDCSLLVTDPEGAPVGTETIVVPAFTD